MRNENKNVKNANIERTQIVFWILFPAWPTDASDMSRQSLKILIPVLVLSIAVSIAKIFVPLNRPHSGLQQKEAFDHVEGIIRNAVFFTKC